MSLKEDEILKAYLRDAPAFSNLHSLKLALPAELGDGLCAAVQHFGSFVYAHELWIFL